MHYIVSIHYPSLREIHSTLHADPAAALAEYNRHNEASEKDAALFPPGRTVSVSEVVSVGDNFGYTNILKQGQLEQRVERLRQQEKGQALHAEKVGQALPLLKDLLRVGALGDGDARALRVAIAALKDLGFDKAS